MASPVIAERRVARFATILPLLVVTSTLALAIGCKGKQDDDATESVPQTKPSAPPLDHLAPGELAPGKDQVLGLVLPRVMKVEKTVGPSTFARGQASPGAVGAYVRARVHGGEVQALPFDGTLFEHVETDGKAKLTIRVEQDIVGSRMEIRDVTPPPKQDLPNDEARWRAAGLKPNGQPLDPTHMQ